MSLISTSSTTQQEAYLFENHYPQPIVIAPNSQICLQKFIHYRGALYEVSTQNNTIGYRFGSASPAANADIPRFVSIPTGTYDGDGLAEAITLALNSVNQQQNYEWTCTFTAAPSTNDDDIFQIQYASVPTPDPNSGDYNLFSSGQLSVSGTGQDNQQAKITYNGTDANHFANVISKRSTLTYLGEQTWSDIRPSHHTELFQPVQLGLVRSRLSDPNAANPNLQFTPERYDLSIAFEGDGFGVFYGVKRAGIPEGGANWFDYKLRRNLIGLFDPIFKANGGVFDPDVKLQIIMTIYATAQNSRRVLIQILKMDAGETEYTPLADGLGGNSPEGDGNPYVKTLLVGTDTFAGLVFDSNDGTTSDNNQKISQHYPKMSNAPFFPAISFQKTGNLILTGYDLDSETWTNPAGTNTITFVPLVDNANGYVWRTDANPGSVQDGLYWYQIDSLTYHVKGGDVPITDPPLYVCTLDPTGDVNGKITATDGTTGTQVFIITFTGTTPVAKETERLSVLTEGIFNGSEPVASLGGSEEISGVATVDADSGGLGVDLNTAAKMFLRGTGAGTGVEADVANLLGFSNNEEDFPNAPGGSITSDTAPQQTANNNTLHISIPEMPLVKSFEGENSSEAKSISIIPREEFATGDQTGSLVYVAPFENWININNGQELNMNLLTTLVRNADGSLADNLVRETQAVFKIRQDPMKVEEDKKVEQFKAMAEMMANTINTGLTSLITPQQLIGS